MIKLTVIICTYNRADTLKKTLESFEQVIVPASLEWEILIIDNGSTDKTKDTAQKHINNSKVPLAYLSEPCPGKSAALNLGIQKARGEIIAFTDDDVLVDKNWLNAILCAVNKYPHSAFGGRIIALWKQPLPSWFSTDGRFNCLRGTVFLRDDGAVDREYDETMTGNVPCGANMFFRREAVKANGSFRSDLGPSRHAPGASEDTEFCRRLLSRGLKFMYVADAVIYHPVVKEKISRESLLRWRYHCAKSEVKSRISNDDMKRICGVPRYLLMQLLSDAVLWLSSVNSSKRFFYKLKTYYTCGEIKENRALHNNPISK